MRAGAAEVSSWGGGEGVASGGGRGVVGDVDAAILDAYQRCLAGKKAGHDIDDPKFLQPTRPLSAIGG